MKNIFKTETVTEVVQRINALNKNTEPNWGKMSVNQMLAHCNVTYETVYEDNHAKPNFFMKFILKKMVKPKVVSEIPYPKNGQTAPHFVIKGSRDFDKEKTRLLDYIERTKLLGEEHFNGKESHSFGTLSLVEWNNLFSNILTII